MEKIDEFQGEYYFMSNFHNSKVELDGIIYDNAEAAFQAQKCLTTAEKKSFVGLNPSEAKRKGRHVKLRSDWEQVKTEVMYTVVKNKFSQNADLREKLLATGDAELIEGNTWHDTCWGVCNGKGENRLGKILVKVRGELRK